MIFNGVHIRPHTELIKQLMRALVSLSEGDKLVPKLTEEQPFVDYLDALRSYYNTARAVDLYLGIENAYSFYGLEDGPLLSLQEKRVLMERMNEDLHLRSEEHTSELQSRGHLVCRLLLEKKKVTHLNSE